MHRKFTTQLCTHCGIEFTHYQRRPQPFCSLSCANFARPKQPLAERFWGKVNKNGPIPSHRPELGPCWPFTGHTDDDGYGRFAISHKQTEPAQRTAWELTYGPIPEGFNACHHCDYRPCCRPSHLFLGTHQVNIIDKVDKGRQARGEQHGMARLHLATVLALRAEYLTGSVSQKDLAEKYGISRSQTNRIVRLMSWV